MSGVNVPSRSLNINRFEKGKAMNKISRFVKFALLGSAFVFIAASSVSAMVEPGGGSCKEPKTSICGTCTGTWCPYGDYTPSAE
jgi:hypothetical protein